MSFSNNYKSISQLEKLEADVSLNDLVLISRTTPNNAASTSEYASQRATVLSFVGTLSGVLAPVLSANLTNGLKDLAYMDPSLLNNHPLITAYVKKTLSAVNAPKNYAISSIHWTNGVIDEVGSIALSDAQAVVTDINTDGLPIAKIDGTQIYNGVTVEQTSTEGFEIAKIDGIPIYAGSSKMLIDRATSRGQDIANVKLSSPAGTTNYTLKNGVDIVASGSQVGEEIFKYNDTPIYNNVKVTSLVSNTNAINAPIADINGAKIYNGVNIGNVTTVGQTIATINGQAIKNGVNINPADFLTNIEINDNLKGTAIATVDGKILRNGVNVDNQFGTKNGIKIANIAGTDLYAPGMQLTSTSNIGVEIANGTDATGKTIKLYSGMLPHVRLTLDEYDKRLKNGQIYDNTYYFTEGRTKNYDEVGYVYRYRSEPDSSGHYEWFEIWPDGWCVQGGKTDSPSYTKDIAFLVEMKNNSYSVNANAEMKTNYGPTGTCAHFNPIIGTYKTTGMTMQTCNHFSALYWEVKGWCNDASAEQAIQTKKGQVLTSSVGITKVQQVVSTGNAPVGQIIAYAGSDIPEGWLLCDGQEVSIATYRELYDKITNSFGNASDTNKFKLPKLTDERYLQGYSKVGIQYTDGLPNITGSIPQTGFFGTAQGTGALTRNNTWQNSFTPDYANDNTEVYCTLNLDASKSNSIYGASSTVRPKSLTVRYLICYKDTSKLADAIESWKDDNTNSWCKKYSNSWCEQGGKYKITVKQDYQKITLHLPYKDLNYTITISQCGATYDENFRLVGNDSAHQIETNSFYVANTLNKGDFIMWETKGYIK